jgi:diaminopimelate epimerase
LPVRFRNFIQPELPVLRSEGQTDAALDGVANWSWPADDGPARRRSGADTNTGNSILTGHWPMKLRERLWTRMNGAGNSFFALDARQLVVEETWEFRSKFARQLCSETSGLSADGLFILESSPSADFKWDFFNSDGSAAEMCGNAARCATRFFLDRSPSQSEVSFETVAGVIVGQKISAVDYRVRMPNLPAPGAVRPLTVNEASKNFYFVNTGVPHLVIEGDAVAATALMIRQAPELGSAGSNVTFVKEVKPGEMKAVTFERGVDDFTLACGTGAVAAAAYGREQHPQLTNFKIQMPGGLLTVGWISAVNSVLTGPAVIDYEIKLGDKA